MSDSVWQTVTLGQLGKVITGKTPSKDHPNDWGDVMPFITPSDYKNYGKMAFASERMLSAAGVERQLNRVLPKNSILVTCIGSDMGKSVMNAVPCVTNQQINSIIPNSEVVDSDFSYYITLNLYNTLRLLGADGTAVPILNKTDFEEIEVLLPKISEQKAIASVLSSLDDKIDLLHRQNKTLESLAETLFRQWFIEEAGEDWEEVRVGDFVELNQLNLDKSYSYQEILYLDTGSLSEGVVSSYETYSISSAPSRAKRLVRHNDILLSTVRPNQKHYGIVKNPPPNLVASTGFCVISATKITPYFIYLLLTGEEMIEHLHSVAEGSTSTYPSLKPSDLASITFLRPPEDLLTIFDSIASAIWDRIGLNLRMIKHVSQTRENLLPKLMSGEISVLSKDERREVAA